MENSDEGDPLESKKFALEKEKFAYQKIRDQAIDRAEQRAKRWAQLSIVVPILAIILSFLTNASLERSKSTAAGRQEQLRVDRNFIDKQLSDLYYPLRLRLEKDSAVWTLAGQLSLEAREKTSPEFSNYVEKSILIPNHEEAIKIIDQNLALIKNGRETYDPTKLMDAINHYQRHVAAYKALRAVNTLSANPIELGEDSEFPKELAPLIVSRINDLEAQRALLSDELRGAAR
ncbi:hypothetical protein [Massilia sp. ST3]|uniref:hypothetical protein n=1 Tax=Massilia sp. ST3 TaxID=2824903 RepID=UPI001B80FB28|nr:hypothetical protein [Massilia sp. ST3]MBQ5946795.1 hypothetical protein [Massilia sp. ST3]